MRKICLRLKDQLPSMTGRSLPICDQERPETCFILHLLMIQATLDPSISDRVAVLREMIKARSMV